MAIDWKQWQAMRASLDYCWSRMRELESMGSTGEPEYDSLVAHAVRTADRLLQLSGAPRLATASMRAQWQVDRAQVMELRERIAAAEIARKERYEAALESPRSDD